MQASKRGSQWPKLSFIPLNRSSPRENSPKPCINMATQSGSLQSRWALFQNPRFTCLLSFVDYSYKHATIANGHLQTFDVLTFKYFYDRSTWHDQCHYWTLANTERPLSLSVHEPFKNGQIQQWSQVIKPKSQSLAQNSTRCLLMHIERTQQHQLNV